MDNLTHTLTAIVLARAGAKRFTPHATAILVLAANIPDVDAIYGFRSQLAYLQHHRGFTHSLVAVPLLAAAVVGIVALVRRVRRARNPFPLLPAFLLALFGVLFGHLFLDWSTSYGTRLLAPFSWRWIAWDAVPIVDFWLLGVLLAAVLLPFFFGMISDEIGARGSERGGKAAVFALIFMLAWFGFRGALHARAVAMLDARLYHGLQPRQVGAFASSGNPFLWYGVVQTDVGWEVATLSVLEDFDPDAARTYYRAEPGPALDAAASTHTARVFLDFARYPIVYAQQSGDGQRVIYRDLRFQNSFAAPKGFVAEIVESRQFQVTGQRFSFQAPADIR